MDGELVVVMGKGRSARFIPQSAAWKLAAVSEACRLAERVDWLAVNVAAVDAMTDEDFAKASRVIVPTKLHADPRGQTLRHWERCVRWTCPTDVYRLHTDPPEHAAKEGEPPYFGRQMSTGESLVSWLLWKGFRRFAFSGVGPGNDYHPWFKPRTLKRTHTHFADNWNRIRRRIKGAGGKIEDIDVLVPREKA